MRETVFYYVSKKKPRRELKITRVAENFDELRSAWKCGETLSPSDLIRLDENMKMKQKLKVKTKLFETNYDWL